MNFSEQKSPSPREGFKNFLHRAENDAWIADFKWVSGDSYLQLKSKLKGARASNVSRTHKKGTDGVWWALETEAHDGTHVGVDLELFMSRPILENSEWITSRLQVSRSLSPQKILEEWSAREAAFKALAPDNENLLLSHFRRVTPNAYTVFTKQGDRSVQVRTAWAGKWLLSLAWLSD